MKDMFMFSGHCVICQDKKRFNVKLQNAKRILHRIKEIERILPQDFMLSKSVHATERTLCKTHVHFMCGHCNQVNIFELKRVEDEILDIALKLKVFCTQNNDDREKISKIKSAAFIQLQGYYPVLCRWFS